MTRTRFLKHALFAAKAAVTLSLIWLVLRNVDMTDTLQRVRSVSAAVAAGVLLLMLLLSLLSILRDRKSVV